MPHTVDKIELLGFRRIYIKLILQASIKAKLPWLFSGPHKCSFQREDERIHAEIR